MPDTELDDIDAEFAAAPSDVDIDAEFAAAEAAPSTAVQPQVAAATPAADPAAYREIPWYETLGKSLARSPWVGNVGDKLASSLLERRKGEVVAGDGDMPAREYGSDSGIATNLEQDWEQQREQHPVVAFGGQVASALPGAIAAAEGGAALGARAGSARIGRALAGAASFFPPVVASQEGSLTDRVGAVPEYVSEHPVQTALGVGLPAVMEAAGPAIGAAGSKLVQRGNEGLARLGLNPGEIGRTMSNGVDDLAALGQRIRDAGLDKSRTMLGKLQPTTAKTLYENSAEKTAQLGGRDGAIRELEEELLSTRAPLEPGQIGTPTFGDSNVNMSSTVEQLRSDAARAASSAEVSGERTAAAMQRQANKFPLAQESVQPPAATSSAEQLSLEGVPAEGGAPSAQLDLLGGEKPVPYGAPQTTQAAPAAPPAVAPRQTEMSFQYDEPQMSLPLDESGQQGFAFQNGTPPVQAPPQPAQGGLAFPEGPNARPGMRPTVNDAGKGMFLHQQGNWPKPMPELPAPPEQLSLGGDQLSFPEVPRVGAGPGLKPDAYFPQPPKLPSEGLEPATTQLPLPFTMGQNQPNLPGVNLAPSGNGLTPFPEPAPAAYPLRKAIEDRRQIGKVLFDTKERPLESSFGQDAARDTAFKGLTEQIEPMLDSAGESVNARPGLVDAYRTARKDFKTAADLTRGGVANRARIELTQNASTLGWAKDVIASPGATYNAGRVAQKVGGTLTDSAPATRAFEQGAEKKKVEQEKNSSMKESMFSGWYKDLLRLSK